MIPRLGSAPRSGNLPAVKVEQLSPTSHGLVQPGRQVSLLSLMGYTDVQRRLLSYVSCGEGGLQALLNFRQSCTTAKSSVARLPPAMRKEMFSRSLVKIDLEFDVFTGKLEAAEILDEFERSPPPDQVTSLKLLGVRSLSAEIFSREEEQLWIRFVQFWWPKLESLEVDFIDNLLRPMDSRLNLLLSSPFLRRLHCHTLQEECFEKVRVELPQRIFHMEHLSIDSLELRPSTTTKFFESLARNPNLKSFESKVKEVQEILYVTMFLVATKEKANLEVTLKMECFKEPIPDFCQLDPVFVSAVATSLATIRILGLDGNHLSENNLKQLVGEKKAREFVKTVEWILEFETAAIDDRLMGFPNLKRLDLLKNPRDRIQLIAFPPCLQRLGVFYGIPGNLPLTLTHLDIRNYKSSVPELMESLVSIDRSCPNLQTLEMKWRGDSSMEIFWNCDYGVTDVVGQSNTKTEASTVFRKLKSLTFTVDASYRKKCVYRVPANLNGVRWILLNGFQLQKLSLLNLTLAFEEIFEQTEPPPVLDCSTLDSVINGTLGLSLVGMKIAESFITPDARSLERKLSEKVSANAVRRRSVGMQVVRHSSDNLTVFF